MARLLGPLWSDRVLQVCDHVRQLTEPVRDVLVGLADSPGLWALDALWAWTRLVYSFMAVHAF